MTTPFEPTYALVIHPVTPFGHDHYVIVWQYVRTINNRHPNNIESPALVRYNEKIVLSAFDFKPPYVMNQWFPYQQKKRMDVLWIIGQFWFTHRNSEEKVIIPVPDIFFEEHFIPSAPSTPLPSLPPPTHHHYPPLPSHIDAQLGHTGGCRVVRKGWKRRYWGYIAGLSFGIIVIGMLVIISTLH
ncbi:hypothetical protein M422DRAFT_262788 [Sphaerobolus stellatus SS14]|uniref:Unplaced genomic scaffold SPHSTscaffold_118, whole genome shotgun sequence n=1 Tax=Sphaerobolus stellatus (strain SS14) TaxID=990650 RepID=A0A0C9VC01_SPHS4|nr:hypothetical protein M422DRAFT_262788 [Sphaerobolus stellatus SS14]